MSTTDEAVGYYLVDFQIQASLREREDPSDYVSEINGTIKQVVAGPDSDHEVGRLQAYYVQAGRAENDGESPFEIFDSINNDLAEYY